MGRLLDAITDKHKQSVIADEYRNCEQEAHELLFGIIAYNTLSSLKSSDDVSDVENAEARTRTRMNVNGHDAAPNMPTGYVSQ